MGDKRIIVYSYLCCHRALNDTVGFSVPDLVKWTGLTPNYHKGKINEKYLDVLELLSHYGYFDSCPDFEKLKKIGNSNEHYKAHLNIVKFDVSNEFGIIYFDELQKIINYKEGLKGKKNKKGEDIDITKMSAAYILLLLSYLRVNMGRSSDKPKCCYRLYKKITEDIGLSERYITRIVEMLDVMDIVKFAECKRDRYKKEESDYGFLTTPKVFADFRRFKKDDKGNISLDEEYDYKSEIEKQLDILNPNSS